MTPAQTAVLTQYRAARRTGLTPIEAARQVEHHANIQLLISDYARPQCDLHRIAVQWHHTIQHRTMRLLVAQTRRGGDVFALADAVQRPHLRSVQ